MLHLFVIILAVKVHIMAAQDKEGGAVLSRLEQVIYYVLYTEICSGGT